MAMANGSGSSTKWCFKGNEKLANSSERVTVRGILEVIKENLDPNDPRPTIPLGHGDPSAFPCFRTSPEAEKAVSDALYSAKFNGYSPSVGILPARKAIAEFLSQDLPYKLSPDDIYLTSGGNQSVEVIASVFARPNANILLPKPGYPQYEAWAEYSQLEFRHFDLLPEKDWEVDLDSVEALSDENTVGMVIINPGNPCGNVYKHQHLKKIAETARKLGILVIADEVYSRLTFGSSPFVPMGVFGSITPVITVGSISKRWIVPGWRLGWLAMNDPSGILKKQGVIDSFKRYVELAADPATFIQGAIPKILEYTKEEFFSKIISMLREAAEMCCGRIQEIPSLTCSSKPQGSMSAMVRLNLSLLEGIEDDLDFSLKLAKEESVIVLPGTAVGLKNWLRITFAVEPSSLDDGLRRIKAFCQRHEKKQ